MKTERSALKGGSLIRDMFRVGQQELVHAFVISMFVNFLMLALPLYMLQVFIHVLPSESLSSLVFLGFGFTSSRSGSRCSVIAACSKALSCTVR